MKLAGRVALVTGGTSGIGEAVVHALAREGAHVVFTGRRTERGAAVLAALRLQQPLEQQRFDYCEADHRRPDDCAAAIDAVRRAHGGRLDVLVNNAGVVLCGTAEATSEAAWAECLDVNVTAVWRMSRLALPLLRAAPTGAVIVNNASDWGLRGGRNAVAYCASKGAVVQLTRAMALDHAHEGIRVVAVCPGDTFVERWTQEGYFHGSGAVSEAAARRDCAEDVPLGRVGEVDEVARAVVFLTSDDAAFVTGTTLSVDGGAGAGH